MSYNMEWEVSCAAGHSLRFKSPNATIDQALDWERDHKACTFGSLKQEQDPEDDGARWPTSTVLCNDLFMEMLKDVGIEGPAGHKMGYAWAAQKLLERVKDTKAAEASRIKPTGLNCKRCRSKIVRVQARYGVAIGAMREECPIHGPAWDVYMTDCPASGHDLVPIGVGYVKDLPGTNGQMQYTEHRCLTCNVQIVRYIARPIG